MSRYQLIYRSVIRLIIALVVLAVIGIIVSSLPGTNFVIPGTPFITVSAIASVIVALIQIGIVVRFGREINPSIRRIFPGNPEFGLIASNAVVVIAIWIAYDSFGGISIPLLVQAPWAYPLIFLLLALVPAFRIATTLMGNIDKWTGQVESTVQLTASGKTTCPNCQKELPKGTKFCNFCGASLEIELELKGNKCPTCGKVVPTGSKFCNECGTKIP